VNDFASTTDAHGLSAERPLELQEFESLREKRAYERRYLPFLKTVVDFDVACEIGYHQATGNPLTVKQLLLLKLAPPATVLRRLDRLCALGIVARIRSRRDRRVQQLRLSPETVRLIASSHQPGTSARLP
jgi:DNA-binding MarR family transcriptional regulator